VAGVRRDGRAMQPQGHVQILVNLIDYDLNLQEAGDAARWQHDGSTDYDHPKMTDGGYVYLESGVPWDAVANSSAAGTTSGRISAGTATGDHGTRRTTRTLARARAARTARLRVVRRARRVGASRAGQNRHEASSAGFRERQSSFSHRLRGAFQHGGRIRQLPAHEACLTRSTSSAAHASSSTCSLMNQCMSTCADNRSRRAPP